MARRSVWAETSPTTDYPPLGDAARFDVVVVGGGITGLTTALLLARDGARVALLERRRIATGATGNTTAKVTSLHGLTYARLLDERGEAVASAYGTANQAALQLVADLVAEYAIDCRFERAPAYTYTTDPGRRALIDAEIDVARRLGLPADGAEVDELPFAVAAAVRFHDQAHFHPRDYCLGLAKALAQASGAIFEQTAVLGVDERDGRVAVETNHGTVEADRVVLATLLPFHDPGGYFAKTTAVRSYALHARLRGAAPAGMYLSIDSPTRSIRPVNVDGDHGRGVVLGGNGHETGHELHPKRRAEELEAWARATFDVESIEQAWSAQDYRSVDGVPYVGRSPRTQRIYVATGLKKWGMTNGTAAAMLLADDFAGRKNEWAPAFDATRIGDVRAVARLVHHNARVGTRFVVDRVARAAAGKTDRVPPGGAAIVRVDGHTLGAYRDEAGALHAVKITCTHLGCTLRFNDAETSWDCPCHGSRFTADGAVIEGPAVRDLDVVPVDGSTAT